MKVERDIAGLALPFAAGTAITAYAGSLFSDSAFLWTSAAFILVLLCTDSLLLKDLDTERAWSVWIRVAAAGLAAGFLCGLAAELSSVSFSISRSWIAETGGRAMTRAIDGISFSDKDTKAIITALITGDKKDIPQHITDAFRDSGASHILALSGLHLGIIYGSVTKIISFLGNSPAARKTKAMTAVILCGAYTLATGAGASIVRAFLFIVLAEASKLTGRYRSTGSILLAALIIQLTISPQSIRSIGFQLSYAAMAGIAFIYPGLRNIWPEGQGTGMKALGRLWNSAAISIACQITTGPLAYFYFGTLPKYFMLTNLIAVPLTGAIIPSALVTTALSICGICPDIMIVFTESLVKILVFSLSTIATM